MLFRSIVLSLVTDPVSIIDPNGKIRTYTLTDEAWTIKNGRYFANAERRPRINPEEIKDQPRFAEVLGDRKSVV